MKTVAPILHYFPLPLYLFMLVIFAFVSVSNMLVLLLLDFSSSKHFSLIPLGEGEDLAFFFPNLSLLILVSLPSIFSVCFVTV